MTELETLRHSCAHVLANAILKLWPEAQFAAGPPTAAGFYYDVDLPHRITPEDFERLEKEMRQITQAAQPFERQVISLEEALAMGQRGELAGLGHRSSPSRFKLDIIQNIPENETITLYRNGEFTDLCAGPHVADTSKIGAFRLTHVASAYYKGDENNPQLQRIYGTAFATQEELDRSIELLEEAKKRDHRKIGREQGLFHIDDMVGQGLILWTPKGAIIRQELQNFIGAELRKQGYSQVFTPHIGRLDLFRTSGHFPYYAESQFPPIIDRETIAQLAEEKCSCAELSNRLEQGAVDGYLLKPMNCPMHIKIFDSQPRSYRDLPVRLAEFGTVYRWEQSGELNGMTRVRGFTQDDAHLFCTEEQISAEIRGCLDLVKTVLTTFQLTDYRVRIGLRDPASEKYVGANAHWEKAEEACREAAKSLGVSFSEEPGEAAFYGPKIDFVVKDVLGRDWQLGTVQVDFNLPRRFDLKYTGPDGKQHVPVMIHRAPFGSLERFMGVLIEHFAGNFPLWLAPEQVRVLPISEKLTSYAQTILSELISRDVRATADFSSEKIGAKIRLAQMEKVPYMLIVGGREEAAGLLSLRSRSQGDEGSFPKEIFYERLQEEIKTRK
ncbi:MAG: threonine--tRNA ligase [Chthoniobacterales bacterium]|nr:threonine--tRNA ligase [Chthoniobacterales bacterium]